jgi:hypothetical protein
MPVFSTWRSQRTLTGGLVSGFFLLLTSIFGPFLLRTFQRRRRLDLPYPTENKTQLMIIERTAEDSPCDEKVGAATEEPQPAPIQNSPEEELERYYAFIAQFPSPTLSCSPLTGDSTLPQTDTQAAEIEGIKTQRLYQDICPSGEVRSVLEQQHDFSNGRRWRRKLVVYSGGIEGSTESDTRV